MLKPRGVCVLRTPSRWHYVGFVASLTPDLFHELVYDQLEPGTDAPEDAFTFDLHSEDAPHFPMRVRWNARFQEFDPLLGRSAGGVDDTDIDLAFGPFVQEVIDALPELAND